MKDENGVTFTSGQALISLARWIIVDHFSDIGAEKPALHELLQAEDLQANRGVFVTLHKRGQLRGCIGNLSSCEPIVDGVRHHAINAAFNDHRFKPLAIDEVDEIDIEVSILSVPQPLEYENDDDLIAKLQVDIDGVIVRQGSFSATFLPQVWQQLPDPVAFLGHLCQKAGLASEAWRAGGLEVLIYQVQYFSEKCD